MSVHDQLHFSTQRVSVLIYLNPRQTVMELWRHRGLIREFSVRDTMGRYKGSSLGLLWSIILPLLMLGVYAFVFTVVFQPRWGSAADHSVLGFALSLFCGMCCFQLFSESIGRAPQLIVSNPNFVKKVVFPLEVFPLATLGTSLFHCCISLSILMIASAIYHGGISPAIICLPMILLPLALLTAGLAWFLASLGVYVRDIGQIIAVMLQVLTFLTPVFYPISAVPKTIQTIMRLNPLAEAIEDARRVILWNQWPDWNALLLVTLLSAVTAQLGYAWFMKTKQGFCDVI